MVSSAAVLAAQNPEATKTVVKGGAVGLIVLGLGGWWLLNKATSAIPDALGDAGESIAEGAKAVGGFVGGQAQDLAFGVSDFSSGLFLGGKGYTGPPTPNEYYSTLDIPIPVPARSPTPENPVPIPTAVPFEFFDPSLAFEIGSNIANPGGVFPTFGEIGGAVNYPINQINRGVDRAIGWIF